MINSRRNINKNISLNIKCLILILFTAFSLRLFSALKSSNPIIKDGIIYDSVAVNLISGKGYSLDGQHPTSQVPPFYPYFLAAIYAVFGHNYKMALIFQAIIGTLNCFLIYQLSKGIFKEQRIALLAGLISSLYYYFIREEARLWTEPLFMFLLVLVVLYYVKMIIYQKIFYAAIFGLSSAALILTRPGSLFLPFMIIGVDYFWIRRTLYIKSLFTYVRYLSIALVFFAAPITLWATRNFVVQKEFVLVATGGGRNFYEAFNPYEGKKFGITVTDEIIKKGEKNISSEVLRDRFYFREGVKSIFKKNLLELFKLTVLKGLTFWSLIDWGAMGDGKAVFNFCTSFILPFIIISIILLRKNKHGLFILLIPVIYFFFFSLVFMGLPRFRLPVEPFLVILAAYSLTHLFTWFPRKIIPTVIVSSWFTVNFILFLNSEYIKESFKRIAETCGLW